MEAGELNLHIKRVSSALPGAQSPLPAQGQTTEHQREARRKPLNVAPSQVNVAQWLPASPHFTENVTLCAESLVVTCSLLHNSAHVLQLLSPRCRAHTLQQEKPPQWEARAPQFGCSSRPPQLEKSPHAAMKTQGSHKYIKIKTPVLHGRLFTLFDPNSCSNLGESEGSLSTVDHFTNSGVLGIPSKSHGFFFKKPTFCHCCILYP